MVKTAMPTDRELRLTYDDLDELAARFHPENPKRHELVALDASFDDFGYVTPPVVNDADGLLLEAHGRIEALLARRASGAEPPPGIQLGPSGEWLVPTVHGVELDRDAARAFLVAANRIVELGGWDERRLADLLGELRQSDAGLNGTGFSPSDLSALLAQLGDPSERQDVDPDEIPSEPAKDDLYVSRGQLWQLGSHQVLCGDATEEHDVHRLVSGHAAHMGITDPPYNVNYGRHGAAGAGRRKPTIANDALAPKQWIEFVEHWARLLVDNVDGALYVFMSSREWPVVARLLEEAGAYWSDTIVWAKDRFVLGRADYQRQYEPLWYGWRRGSRHHWCGDRDQGDVWQFPRPASSDLHPTMKPIALIERGIANSSTPGGRVLDPFLGSGTTLIACERLGRRCLGLELEPKYVQVAIERWQQYTGRTAALEEE